MPATSAMPPLLLLHGAMGCQANFDALRPYLSPYFALHSLDFWSHGTAPTPSEGNLSIALFAEQVRCYCAEHFDQPVPIFGYSMGGYVACYLARHYPQTVAWMHTLATKWTWSPDIAQRETALLNPDRIAEKVPKYAASLAQQHGAERWRDLLLQTAQMMRAMGDAPPLSGADFAAVAPPIRLSVGDRDAMVSLEETIGVYRQLPNAQLAVLPQTPHPLDRANVAFLSASIQEMGKLHYTA